MKEEGENRKGSHYFVKSEIIIVHYIKWVSLFSHLILRSRRGGALLKTDYIFKYNCGDFDIFIYVSL